ncbi:MAG: peptidase M20 [Anaerolineae bacterium SM23_ 63]|nr:MAG: peptidase M20 [Anaerolineae bacterium SM23_ 63]
MAMAEASSDPLYTRPIELLQNLIRFDTTNPPGNEVECVMYIDRLLNDAGMDTSIFAKDPNRPNLIARLKGRGSAPPLLLYGHVDVVTTEDQDWTYPPFEGKVHDGYIWGRGALDMKSGVAMMLAAVLRAKAEDLSPPGDVVLAILCDEEAGGVYGAMHMVDEHPDQFEGIRYALGEFGGASFYIAGKTFYPIQVAEKQICWMRGTVRGPGGHGSRPMRGGAMAKLGRVLQRLDRSRLPIHITTAARQMFEIISSSLPLAQGFVLRQLLNPALTDTVLKLTGEHKNNFEPLFRNTVNATIVHGGDKINVIPSKIVFEMDGRLLPGFTPDDMITELRPVLEDDVELELIWYDAGPAELDMGLFNTLAAVLQEFDPGGIVLPMLLPAVTDARHFSRLGIQSYGFTPMKLPEEFKFFDLAHATNERLPVDAVEFGTNAIYSVLQRFGE